MNNRILLCCGLVLATILSGCVTAPPAEGAKTSAYSVGDRERVMFDEIVVSLPFRGTTAPYQNLHVAPAALVNVRKTTYSQPYQAEGILRRQEARLAARITEVLSNLGPQALADTPALRNRVIAEAQAVVNDAMQNWEHGAEYRIEVVIASMYWTDASVGRVQTPRSFLW